MDTSPHQASSEVPNSHELPKDENTQVRNSNDSNFKLSNRIAVLYAIYHLNNPQGSSLTDIKKYMSSAQSLSPLSQLILKMILKEAIYDGILTEMGGKFKIREAAIRRLLQNCNDPMKTVKAMDNFPQRISSDVPRSRGLPQDENPQERSRHSKLSDRIAVLYAIHHLRDRQGSSLAAIKKYMSSNQKLSAVAAESKNLKLILKDAVNYGILSEMGGKFKIKEAAIRRRSRSKRSTKCCKRRSRSKKRSASGKCSRSRKRRRSLRRTALANLRAMRLSSESWWTVFRRDRKALMWKLTHSVMWPSTMLWVIRRLGEAVFLRLRTLPEKRSKSRRRRSKRTHKRLLNKRL